MEAIVQPESLSLTSKLERDKNVNDSSATVDHLNNAAGECNESNILHTISEDQVDLCPAEGGENHGTIHERSETSESSDYQLVLYDPAINNGGGNDEIAPNPICCPPPLQKLHPFSDRTPRVLPSIGDFTVQCANCFKWRLIPTKEKYEEIREHILEQPFFCETAREWRLDISCDDPPDITPDGSRLWAIDKPNIAQPPHGWQRLLRIRGEGGSKFADVYYVAPSGKTLRSVKEIQRYLDKHPEYMTEGVSLSRFSFQIPKPLQEDYVRKRPAHPALRNDADDLGVKRYLPTSEVARLTWVATDVDTDLQHHNPVLANEDSEAPVSNPDSQFAKRGRGPSSPSRFFN